MKDINITLFIEHEVDDQELQAKLLEFLESIDGVEQVDITIDNVDETA